LARLWYCDHHELPLPPGHKFPAQKYSLLRVALGGDARFTFEPAPLAAVEAIELAHDPAYVQAVLNGSVDPRIIRRIGFPWSEGLVRRTLASVGGTLRATEDALAVGWGGNLAGGTHHAFYAEGSGFCVFNDLAIAIRFAARRAAIIDLDVHQGDGSAAIFAGDPEVFTLSLHGGNNFPFRKQQSTLDVALPDGTCDDEYLSALAGALPKLFASAPEIVFYQAGVDGLASDKLGRLGLTPAGLRERDRMVFEACRAHGLPCVVTLGGGYSEPIALTVTAHVSTFRAAADLLGS
jgi:acetoin utilization deacetylase AcuC-like enzyme